jgi:AbrB family looped-hinge helix DNA binding protein
MTTIKVDRRGRILIPQAVRERLHLSPGSSLNLEESPDGLVLKLVKVVSATVMRDGLWIYVGHVLKDFTSDAAPEEDRRQRDKHILRPR